MSNLTKMKAAGFSKLLGVAFVMMAGSALWASGEEETVVACGEREFALGTSESDPGEEEAEVVACGEREFALGPVEEAVVAFDEREFYLGPVRIARAVVADAGKTLRFIYDGEDVNHGTKDTDWFSVAEAETIDPLSSVVPWGDCDKTVTKVIFDASFAAYRPKQCANWFYNFTNLTTIAELTNLNTSQAVSMFDMFNGCSKLVTLDLSSFNTSNVTNMKQMVKNCTSLTTIFASELFVVDKVTVHSSMFQKCTSLVGGAGTTYSASRTNKLSAHIDGGETNMGYFTYKSNVPAGSFAIHFAADGGTGTMADQVCERGKVWQLTKNKFTKSGKTFKGWTCSNGRRYDDQILIFNLADSGATVTMTAVWE